MQPRSASHRTHHGAARGRKAAGYGGDVCATSWNSHLGKCQVQWSPMRGKFCPNVEDCTSAASRRVVAWMTAATTNDGEIVVAVLPFMIVLDLGVEEDRYSFLPATPTLSRYCA